MSRKTKMNVLTTADLIKQVNPENIRLKEDFLLYLKSTQKSPKTIYVYGNDLDIFFVWNLQHNGNKFFTKVTKRDFAAYQNWLINENGNSPARVRRLKATLSSMSNYISNILDDEEEFKDYRPIVRKIENPVNQPVREKTVITDEQLKTLLNTLVSREQYDKACMVALAMYSGRRKSELVRFKVSDFRDENLVCDNSLYKTTEKIKTKGQGLGKFIHCYTLANKFRPYFDLWMNYRRDTGIESEWLFPSRENPAEQMNPATLSSWANSFSNILGIDFYWHCLRHAFTTYLVKSGLPDGVIQEIIGWTSSDMVKLYTDIEAEDQIAAWFKGGEIIKSDATLSTI